MGFVVSIATAVVGGGVAALVAPSSVQPFASIAVALLVGFVTVLFVPATAANSPSSSKASSTSSSKSKQKLKKEKAKKAKAKAASAAVSSTDEDDEEENETPSAVPIQKSASAPAAFAAAAAASPASASTDDDDDDDDEEEGNKASATQSKSAKKKAKKKEAERKKKEEEAKKKAEEEALQRQKEEEARRAAAAAAAAAEQERRKAEAAAAAAAAATTSSKKKKKAANGTAAAAVATPAPAAAPVSKASASPAPAAASAPASSKSKATAAAPAPAAAVQQPLNSFNHQDDGGEWTEIKSTSSIKAKHAAAAAAAAAASRNTASSSSSSSPATIVEAADREITVEMNVSNQYHQALIVGKNGATVKLLKEATQVDISMPKKGSGESIIKLRGLQSKVSQCKGAIDSIINNGFSSITHPGFVHDDIFIPSEPKSLLGAVFGKGAENIQAIQRKTNTIITTQKRTPGSTSSSSSSSGGGEKVVIAGVKEDVKAAKAAIKQLMTEQFSPLTHEGWEKVTIEVPTYKLGAVIGKGGCNVVHIENTCDKKIKIIIPRADSSTPSSDVVIIAVAGVPDMIARAHKMIMNFITPKEEETTKDDDDEDDEPKEPLAEADDPFSAQNTVVNPDSLW